MDNVLPSLDDLFRNERGIYRIIGSYNEDDIEDELIFKVLYIKDWVYSYKMLSELKVEMLRKKKVDWASLI